VAIAQFGQLCRGQHRGIDSGRPVILSSMDTNLCFGKMNLNGFDTTGLAASARQEHTHNQSTELTFAKTSEINTPCGAGRYRSRPRSDSNLLLSPTNFFTTVYQTAAGQVSRSIGNNWRQGRLLLRRLANNHIFEPRRNFTICRMRHHASGLSTILKVDPFASLQRLRIPVNQHPLPASTPDPRRFQYTPTTASRTNRRWKRRTSR